MIQRQPTDLSHHDELAVKELRLLKVDQQMPGRAVAVLTDRRLRQFRESDREVFVRAREIDVPAASVAVRRRVENDAAELKRAVEVVDRGISHGARRIEAATSASATTTLKKRGHHHNRNGQQNRPSRRLAGACRVVYGNVVAAGSGYDAGAY